MISKKQQYSTASFLMNGLLILGLFFVSTNVVSSLIGGKFYPQIILKYLTWVFMALAVKIYIKRQINEKPIRIHEYIFIPLSTVLLIMIWYPYPINIIFSIIVVVALFVAYKKIKKVKVQVR